MYQAHEIFAQIVKAYAPPAWTVLSELRDSTGWAGRGQAADAFAFGTWPSRGFRILGFEIKSYRSDWLRELKNPEKAEGLARFSDEWWLITSEDVAKLEEIPSAWGWAVTSEKGLKTMKKPDPQVKAAEISRVFLMSIVRNLEKTYVRKSVVDAEVEKMVEAEIARRRDNAAHRLESLTEEVEELKTRIKTFEDAAGFSIGERWGDNPKEIGAIVQAVLGSRLKYHIQDVRKAAKSCEKILTTLDALPIFKEEKVGA